MRLDSLVKMANQIGAYFQSYPDADHAAAETATHLRRFWTREMRAQLLDHARRGGDAGLLEPVRRALRLIEAAQ